MPDPTVSEIRAAIAEKIFSVAPAIAVHDYERYTKNMSDLKALYLSTDPLNADAARLNGYHVRKVSTRRVFVDTGRWSIWHRWRIRGLMALDDADATEKIFDEQIETIADAFRADDTLGGLIAGTVDPESGEAGLQVLESKPVMFADVLSHWAELGLTTQHFV